MPRKWFLLSFSANTEPTGLRSLHGPGCPRSHTATVSFGTFTAHLLCRQNPTSPWKERETSKRKSCPWCTHHVLREKPPRQVTLTRSRINATERWKQEMKTWHSSRNFGGVGFTEPGKGVTFGGLKTSYRGCLFSRDSHKDKHALAHLSHRSSLFWVDVDLEARVWIPSLLRISYVTIS